MAEYLIQSETLTGIGDEVRILSGATGTMTPAVMKTKLQGANSEVSDQTDLIAQIQTALESKASASTLTLQSKTITPTTSSQSVTADSGYDGLSKVTVNAMPIATQATPSITVSSSGLITASATQTAGYVAAGTKSATKQLTTKAATTITPTTSEQVAVSAGTYVTGDIKVAAASSGGSNSSGTPCSLTFINDSDYPMLVILIESSGMSIASLSEWNSVEVNCSSGDYLIIEAPESYSDEFEIMLGSTEIIGRTYYDVTSSWYHCLRAVEDDYINIFFNGMEVA